jgi:hypothetical protein
MARSKEMILKEIGDDLDPKGATVAWYDPTTNITYGDAEGKSPAEPYDIQPIRNNETGQWEMKEIWTTKANFDKHLKPIFDRLQDADSGGSLMVLEKSEVDNLKDRIKELEADLRDMKSSGAKKSAAKKSAAAPVGGGTRHMRIWLRTEGINTTLGGRGRITDADKDKYLAYEEKHGVYVPSSSEVDEWNTFLASLVGQDTLPDGDDDSDDDNADGENSHESETAAEALAVSQETPAFTGGDDTIRKATNHLREAKGEKPLRAAAAITEEIKTETTTWLSSEGGTAWLNENQLVAA